MAELDDRFSDDSSSEMSLTPSQSASQSVSQSSGSFTNLPHAGGDAIEKHLSEEHAQRIIKGFKKFFDEDYNEQGSPFHQQSVQTRPNYLIDEDFYDKPEDLLLKDEITEYFSLPLLPVEDPLEWWRQHQTSLPKLARMAFDILSIPATSCEVERVFSQSKLTISTQRCRLMDQTIEQLVCLKYWLSKRVF
jgi:hypothetical protein